jgi:uncharacterized protein YjbJ (UPF0337 family)
VTGNKTKQAKGGAKQVESKVQKGVLGFSLCRVIE